MWVFIDTGFVSIVEKREDVGEETLTVRARDAGHLEAFVHAGGDTDFVAEFDMATDYPFRHVMSRAAVGRALMSSVDEIRYSNFKNQAKAVGGEVYARVLGRIWTSGLDLTPRSVAERVNARWQKMDDAFVALPPKKKAKKKSR